MKLFKRLQVKTNLCASERSEYGIVLPHLYSQQPVGSQSMDRSLLQHPAVPAEAIIATVLVVSQKFSLNS